MTVSSPRPVADHEIACAPPDLTPLARPGGTFAMVAMDQRESLRTMLAEARGTAGSAVGDDELAAFKLAVARTLGPLSSGFLIDRHLVLEDVRRSGWLGGGLLLAADALAQPAGGPVEDTDLDRVVTDELDLDGVAGIKLLVAWRRDQRRAARVEMARSFVAAARRRGVLSVLEPVVRPTPAELAAGCWDADLAAREAAEELSPLGPDLYKAQVPGAGSYPPAELERACARLGAAIAAPWVVLSQGVPLERFPAAVAAACRGGASGFLAGRALWSDVLGSADPETALREISVPRLTALAEVVDRLARPWTDAVRSRPPGLTAAVSTAASPVGSP